MSLWSYSGQSYDGILWREDTESILLGCWYRICGDRFLILDWFIQFVLCFLFLSLLSLPCHSSLGLPLTHPCPHSSSSSFSFPLILQHSCSHIFPSPPTLLNTELLRSMDWCNWLSMKTAVHEPDEGWGDEDGSDDWACQYHQWQSHITREVPK